MVVKNSKYIYCLRSNLVCCVCHRIKYSGGNYCPPQVARSAITEFLWQPSSPSPVWRVLCLRACAQQISKLNLLLAASVLEWHCRGCVVVAEIKGKHERRNSYHPILGHKLSILWYLLNTNCVFFHITKALARPMSSIFPFFKENIPRARIAVLPAFPPAR